MKTSLRLLTFGLITTCLLTIPCSADYQPTVGLQTWTCRNMEFDEVVAFAVEHKITYLQMAAKHLDPAAPKEELLRKKAVLEQHGLVCYTFGVAKTSMDKGQNRRWFELARLFGAKVIVVEPKNMAEWDNLEELVKEYDIKLAIHNHGKGTAYGDPTTIKHVLASRDHRIGVCMDLGHVSAAGHDVAKLFQEYGAARVFDLHIKDKRVDRVGDKTVIRDVPLGEGLTNYRALFDALKSTQWRGIMAIETDNDQVAAAPSEFVTSAIAFVEANAR